MTGPEPIVWSGLTQRMLDAGYNNMAAVADSAERLADWSARSLRLRQTQPAELEVAYGPGERNRFDVFRCGRPNAPLLVFVHGGWWQRNSKEVFSCMAEGPMARGFDVAMVGYTLAPDARLTAIVREIAKALDALAAHQSERRRPSGCLLSGWSAGGHLTTMALDHPSVRSGLSISGVFDLEPIRLSYINDKLRLDELEAMLMSPAHLPPPTKPLTLVYGQAELSELRRQSEAYAAANPATALLALPGEDHFSILEQLSAPDGAITAEIVRMAAG